MRVCEPEPHDAEHMVYWPQAPTTQSTGHACVLHGLLSVNTGHCTPPLDAYVTMLRVRICVPLPHVAVHIVYSDHCPTTQSTGHACVLHVCVSTSAPHTSPPLAAAVTMVRVRDCEPVPHDLLHVEYAELHSDNTQSTGHACVLHVCTSVSSGQATPPCMLAVTTVRVRDCEPVPHVLLHVVYDADHWLTTQSTGQACVLQSIVSDRAGHPTPPWTAGVITVRVRDCVPVPHVLLHVDPCTLTQLDTTQSPGHGCSLQAVVSPSGPQGTPPLDAAVTTVRVRDC